MNARTTRLVAALVETAARFSLAAVLVFAPPFFIIALTAALNGYPS